MTADAVEFSTYRNTPEVSKFQTAFTLDQTLELIEKISRSNAFEKGQWFQFAIELKKGGQVIGDIGFFNGDNSEKSMIGYTLNQIYQKQGYAFEAVGAVLDFYRQLGVPKVFGSTVTSNTSSINLLLKLGFTLCETDGDDVTYFKILSSQPVRLG